MNPIVRNILAVIVGFVVGSAVNMGLVIIGPSVISLPEGVDMSDMENFGENLKLFTPANFLFPFLAHALGTLAGAFIAAKLAASHHMKLAIVIGVCFQIGGLMMVGMYGGPTWFILTDIELAYLPMGFLGGVLARGKRPPAA